MKSWAPMRVANLLPVGLLAAAVLVSAAGKGDAQLATAPPSAPIAYLDQGWSAQDRETFYRTSQGSHLMPYAWFKALKQAGANTPFAIDQLSRYGYLTDDSPQNIDGLPIGFVIDARSKPNELGLTCAACHTGQLDYIKDGVSHTLRIDGAPALADFQQFLTDLDDAARETLADSHRFDDFARIVLGADYSPAAVNALQGDFGQWFAKFDAIMSASLPKQTPWGPGRLDAFGMIFNRVTGLDLDDERNYATADAPVSYPFLWNAHAQDKVQWNGAAPNGLYVTALGRNTGEVFGVFADFKPYALPLPTSPSIVMYNSTSADFEGLATLEEKLAALKPPPWPKDLFGFNQALANRGAKVFSQNCASCHYDRPSSEVPSASATPLFAVGTDPRMVLNSGRTAETGILENSVQLRLPAGVFGPRATAGDILQTSVVGSLIAHAAGTPFGPDNAVWRALRADAQGLTVDQLPGYLQARLANLYRKPSQSGAGAAYEARSLHGIWATGPYLHNGSVPNLWELLTPPAQRHPTFYVGSRTFDPVNVGFASDKSPYKTGNLVTDLNNSNGNGNAGHDYGTQLSSADRWALIEYLKSY